MSVWQSSETLQTSGAASNQSSLILYGRLSTNNAGQQFFAGIEMQLSSISIAKIIECNRFLDYTKAFHKCAKTFICLSILCSWPMKWCNCHYNKNINFVFFPFLENKYLIVFIYFYFSSFPMFCDYINLTIVELRKGFFFHFFFVCGNVQKLKNVFLKALSS